MLIYTLHYYQILLATILIMFSPWWTSMIREELTSRYRMYRIPMMHQTYVHCTLWSRTSWQPCPSWSGARSGRGCSGWPGSTTLTGTGSSASRSSRTWYFQWVFLLIVHCPTVYFMNIPEVFDLMGRGKEDEELIKIAVRDKIKNIHEVGWLNPV